MISVLKVRWNRQQKRATCFATLLQSELLRVLPPNNRTFLATNEVISSSETFWQKVDSSSLFCNSVHMLRVLPAQGKLVLQQVTQPPCTTWVPPNCIQPEVSIHATWYVARQVWFLNGNMRNIAFQLFCRNAKQVARFRCPFDRSSCSPHAFPFSPSQPLCGSAVLHPWKRNTKQTVLICYVERILGALFNSALQLSDGTMEFCQTGILAVESCWHCRWIHTMLNTFANAPPLQAIDQTPRALSTKANSESFRRFRRQIVRCKTRNSW